MKRIALIAATACLALAAPASASASYHSPYRYKSCGVHQGTTVQVWTGDTPCRVGLQLWGYIRARIGSSSSVLSSQTFRFQRDTWTAERIGSGYRRFQLDVVGRPHYSVRLTTATDAGI